MIGVYYSSYRHWGHPFINYKVGLKKLFYQVHKTKTISDWYVKAWVVDPDKLEDGQLLKPFVKGNCWTPCSMVQSFGDRWDEIPLLPCFEIPNALDPSALLADRSHSPTREELENWLRQRNPGAFKTHKVLETALHTKCGHLKEFCQMLNDEGLSLNDLIIGLRSKEHESKVEGRFFAMMSWNLRLYFVVTEYLI